MERLLRHIYNATYLSIFFVFMRKILDKISLMFDECVPTYNDDNNDWWAIRIFHRYFVFVNIESQEGARRLAMELYRAIPNLRGNIEVVQHEDPEETDLRTIRGLSSDDIDEMLEIWNNFED